MVDRLVTGCPPLQSSCPLPPPPLPHPTTPLQARNGLENYAYSMRNTIKDANLADKLSAEDKEAIEKAVDKVVEWLDHNQVRCVLCLQHSGWLAGCPAGGVVLGAPLVGKASAVAPAKWCCHATSPGS